MPGVTDDVAATLRLHADTLLNSQQAHLAAANFWKDKGNERVSTLFRDVADSLPSTALWFQAIAADIEREGAQ